MSAQDPAGSLRDVVETTGLIAAPTSVLVALLYYFGYIREQALFGYFGVDQATLGFSVQDYLVRSVGVAFPLLTELLVSIVIGFAAHAGLAAWLRRPPAPPARTRRVAAVLGGGAVLLVAAGTYRLAAGAEPGPPVLRQITPLRGAVALGVGAVMAAYATSLLETASRRRARRPRRRPARRPPPLLSPHAIALRKGVVAGIVLAALFWATSIAAQQRGTAFARVLSAHVDRRPQVIVYSERQLHIDGVRPDPLDTHNSAYAYRYRGLHLLVHTNGRWLLLPPTWRRDNSTPVIVLPDNPALLRVDLLP